MLPTATLAPYALRCESLVDPLGIGRSRPALSWKLKEATPGLKNLRQTAYEIRVGSTPGKNDLWKTGRVGSSAQYGVVYGGKPMTSGQHAWWSVRTWDGANVASDWSRPATFAIGLLGEKDWKGKWIAYDAPNASPATPFAGASWIWASVDGTGDVPATKRTFSRRFDLAAKPATAPLAITADDAMMLWVNGQEVYRSRRTTDEWRTPVRLDIQKWLKAGTNEIRVEVENATKSPAGLIVRLQAGSQTVVSDGSWKAEGGVRVIAPYGSGAWGRFAEARTLRPSTVYRKSFAARKSLRRATAYVTALGLVDLYVNGKRVTEDLFTPGWTNYHKRVYSSAYDVTSLMKAGQSPNAAALELGDGWYSGYVGYGGRRAWYGERPRVRAQFVLEYTDGSRETVGTDGSWTAATGARRVQDFLVGEEYDARLVAPNEPVRARMALPNAKVITGIKTLVQPFPGVPVRPYDRLKPISIKPSKAGYILDFGQNLAGFAHLKASGKPGQTIEMRFVEILNPDGTPYTANLRGARAIDKYTFGTRPADWAPRFTFHGFRYLEVVGLGRKPKPEEFTAVAISSATPETGTFECSDPMLNKLSKNAWWTQKMNFIDVPTDCPQRDERLGWTGDAQAYVRTAATYSDVQPFFAKWLVALDDDQRKDGQYPMVAPQIVAEDDGGPAWADAGTICPWTIYGVYGDKRLLKEHYPQMRKFVEFCRKRSGDDLLPPKNFHCFGDWLSINANTPNEVIYEAYFALSTRLVAKAARELGYVEDAERYTKLFMDIKSAFNRAYVSPEGVVKGDTQTAYVLAIAFDLLDEATTKKAAAHLVSNIQARGWHLSTGFVGTRDLMQALSKIGRNDVAFRLLHNTTFPSWGFEIKNGATTVWERWDGWTPERGFQDPGMNSFAHYAYGAVMGWVFSTIGGIDHEAPGFETMRIAPKIDPRLTWAKTSFESVRGPVRTEWRRVGGKLTLTVAVPPNTVADVVVPGGGTKTVGSGTYRFVVPSK